MDMPSTLPNEIDIPEDNRPVPVQVAPLDNTKISRAKLDGVAAMLSSAYSKAGQLSLTKEESDALLKEFPDTAFRPGAAGKENLIYIEHADLRDRLTSVIGLGQWTLITVRSWEEPFELPPKGNLPPVQGVKVYTETALVIRGCFVGNAVGDMDYYPHNLQQNYGDAFEGAKTAAFRRCAKEFGIGLQAWRKNWCDGWWERHRAHPQADRATRSQQEQQDVRDGNARHQQQKAAESRGEAIQNQGQQQQAPQGKKVFKKYECPKCGKEAIMRSQYPPRGGGIEGWYCNPANGGCKQQFKFDDVSFKQAVADLEGGQQAPQGTSEIAGVIIDAWRKWMPSINVGDVEAFQKGWDSGVEEFKKLSKPDKDAVWNEVISLADKHGIAFGGADHGNKWIKKGGAN
jgi:hypothetical protein